MGITEVKPKNNRFPITPIELSLEDYDMFHNIFISKLNISGSYNHWQRFR